MVFTFHDRIKNHTGSIFLRNKYFSQYILFRILKQYVYVFKSFQNRAGWERGPLLLCLPRISLLITVCPSSLWSCPLFVWFWWGCQPQEPPAPLAWPIVVSFIPGHGHFSRIKHMTQAEPIRVILWDFIYGHTLSPWMLLTWSCLLLHLAHSPHCSLHGRSFGKGENEGQRGAEEKWRESRPYCFSLWRPWTSQILEQINFTSQTFKKI